MPWKAYLKIPKGTTPDGLMQMIIPLKVIGQEHSQEEMNVAVTLAKRAAANLLLCGACGPLCWDSGGTTVHNLFEIEISGHANDKNCPQAWQENDSVTVTVRRRPQGPEDR